MSSDTYFFEAGELANSHGNVIQSEAHKLGVGQQTGIDLPSEITGLVPDRAWRAKVAQEELRCERRRHVSSCGISDGRPWSVGDNMHLAVGQGDLLTSPLQMAVAYSTLANAFTNGGNGWVVRPHLGMEIDDTQGRLVQSLSFPAQRHVHLNDDDLSLVMEGIHEAASQPGGTSADVWTGWDQAQHPVYGKTGTAEHAGKEDQSWYMCYIGDPKRPIVIAVTVEQGGFGAETAAPIARLMASQWFGKAEEVRRRELEDVLSPLSPITASEQAQPVADRSQVGRAPLRLPFDPLLTLAVIGLAICSIVTLGGHDETSCPASRTTTSTARRPT